MTKSENIKRIREALKKLNKMDNNVSFLLKEDTYAVSIRCSKKGDEFSQFGAYGCMEFFEDYASPELAYETVRKFAEVMVAATRLNSPKAYHNFAA